jgi:hypothetical protein
MLFGQHLLYSRPVILIAIYLAKSESSIIQCGFCEGKFSVTEENQSDQRTHGIIALMHSYNMD